MEVYKKEKSLIGENLSKYLMELIFSGTAQTESLQGEYKGALDFQFKYSIKKDELPIIRQLGVQVKTGKFGNLLTCGNKYAIKNVKEKHKKKMETI